MEMQIFHVGRFAFPTHLQKLSIYLELSDHFGHEYQENHDLLGKLFACTYQKLKIFIISSVETRKMKGIPPTSYSKMHIKNTLLTCCLNMGKC